MWVNVLLKSISLRCLSVISVASANHLPQSFCSRQDAREQTKRVPWWVVVTADCTKSSSLLTLLEGGGPSKTRTRRNTSDHGQSTPQNHIHAAVAHKVHRGMQIPGCCGLLIFRLFCEANQQLRPSTGFLKIARYSMMLASSLEAA